MLTRHPPTGRATYTCPLCGLPFGGPESFDLHRVPVPRRGNRCASLAELPGLGLSLSAGGRWMQRKRARRGIDPLGPLPPSEAPYPSPGAPPAAF